MPESAAGRFFCMFLFNCSGLESLCTNRNLCVSCGSLWFPLLLQHVPEGQKEEGFKTSKFKTNRSLEALGRSEAGEKLKREVYFAAFLGSLPK
jgi:hypothetical protein